MNNLTYHFDEQFFAERPSQFEHHGVVFSLVGIFCTWIIIAITMIFSEGGYSFLNLNLFPLTLFVGGLLCTSYYFWKKELPIDHFTKLSVSSKSKFVNRWFIGALIYPTVITLLFWSYSIFADELYFHYSGEKLITFNAIQGWGVEYLKVYFYMQMAILLGYGGLRILRNVIYYFKNGCRVILSFFINVLQLRMMISDSISSFLMQRLTAIDKRLNKKTHE